MMSMNAIHVHAKKGRKTWQSWDGKVGGNTTFEINIAYE
jgi:hypothetical protein